MFRTIPRHLSCLTLLGCLDGGDPGSETPPGGQERMCQVDVECPGNILDDPKAPCTMTVTDEGGAGLYSGPAGLELRGRSSLYFPKPQYAIELRQYQELPVWPGSPWSFLDDGSDGGVTWRTLNFDDSGWDVGPAPLGHGEDYLQTTVEPSGGPSVTTYFRYRFNVVNKAEITDVDLGFLGNDGVAVYLNGTEVWRDNLAPGADYATPALSPTSGLQNFTWRGDGIDPELLRQGENVLAVEVHRADPSDTSLRFDLYLEATGEDQSVDFMQMGSEADWVLNGQYADRVLFRNKLAYDLFQSLGGPERYATETRFCELTHNGEYKGIFTLGEKLERDDDRLDIGKDDSFLVKLDDELGFYPNGVGFGTWQLEYPKDDPENVAAVSATLAGWESAVLGPDPADPDTGIFAWLDLDSAVDWVLLNELMKNHDAYFLSVYLWKDEGGKMHFAPWDFDLSMGSYPYTDCTAAGWNPRTYQDYAGEIHDIEFISEMAQVPAFREALAARWRDLRQNEFSEETLLARIAEYDAAIEPALQDNLEQWPVEDIAFSTFYPVEVDNWLCPVSSYEEEHERVLSFVHDRLAWMDEHIEEF